MPTRQPTTREERMLDIVEAAIPVFAERGFRGTSMARLAEAAGVSRPALYQYFDDRADIFRAGFELLLERATDEALLALGADGSLADRLDGYLQRLSGDAYESLAGSEHGAELMEAKHEFAADVAAAALDRAHRGLRDHLRERTGADRSTRSAIVELLTLSPAGLKADLPSPRAYRRRLTTLAGAAAALAT